MLLFPGVFAGYVPWRWFGVRDVTLELALTRSRGLFLYWALWFAAVSLFILGYEEPTLRRHFGAEYDRYVAAVRRWLPRIRPWHPDT